MIHKNDYDNTWLMWLFYFVAATTLEATTAGPTPAPVS